MTEEPAELLSLGVVRTAGMLSKPGLRLGERTGQAGERRGTRPLFAPPPWR
jgi:hypothetical protein